MDIQIIPAILAREKEDLLKLVAIAESVADKAQIDITDGIFTPSLTVGAEDISALQTKLDFEIHLMVSKPENHIHKWLEVERAASFIIHVESTEKIKDVIDTVKESEKSVGITLNPETPIDRIKPYVDEVDFVQFMTVKPGFYGSKFEESVLEKIKEFHFMYPDMPIQVDGSVNDKTIIQLKEVGVTRFVVGSYIMRSENPKETAGKLKSTM